MSWAITPQTASSIAAGGTRLVESTELLLLTADAEAAGLLPVLLTSPGPSWRGQLALRLEEAIETALARRGACPPGVGAAASLEESLSDQLYRARLLELRGLLLAIPSLAGMASLAGVLDADDSAVLRWWLDASLRGSVLLVLDRANEHLGVYGPPRPLKELIDSSNPLSREEGARALAPEVGESVAAMELSEPPPAVIERDGALAFEQPLEDSEELEKTSPQPQVASPQSTPPEGNSRAEPEVVPAPEPLAELPAAQPHAPRQAKATDTMEPLGDITEAILKSLVDSRPEPEQAPASVPSASRAVAPPLYPNAREEWRTWLSDLSSAHGAKPLAAIERMFVSSYVPLSDAVLRGIADPDAEAVLTRWAKSFARSYEEAFDALRLRGKRPTMVLDVPELALRIGRLHGARSVQLLLIDALRFDLGLRVEQRVRALSGQQAAQAERLLLWSGLPSTTEVQLELIGRGPEGLAEPARGQSFEVPVARGRAATSLRRVKTGHRELLKLDIVEARLSEPGPNEAERLDVLADETASLIAEYLAKQPPRTLVLAFGDHGFLLDPLDSGGTRAARQGGASPEEVLVPAFAWLVGGIH
jgi:hypothetical protein